MISITKANISKIFARFDCSEFEQISKMIKDGNINMNNNKLQK